MDKIEGLIQRYFEEERGRRLGRRSEALYPTADDVYRYLNDELHGEELVRMLEFLRSNQEGQTMILRARELFLSEDAGRGEKVSPEAINKAKALMAAGRQAQCPHCGKAVTPFKRPLGAQKARNLLWAAMTIAAFALSFAFPRYFMQCLLVAGLAGVKAIVDMKATRTQIMVYKALSDPADHPAHATRP
jgi:hypothetical protein